jgi:cell division transport system ATP-binding protein
MIQFHNVSKEYPRTGFALADATFRLHKGEFAFLTGPSGAGKSTILRLAYFEEWPTRGEVRISGLSSKELRKRSDVARLRRKLGIVFQDFRLLDDRSAEANVAFALEVIGTRRDQIGPRVSRALSQVGLSSKLKAFPKELSGGEQQRVALARALINKPAIVLADEPTGNLDSKNSEIVLAMLRHSNQELGQTVLMITHNPEAAAYGDRIIHMRDGEIVKPEKDPQWTGHSS